MNFNPIMQVVSHRTLKDRFAAVGRPAFLLGLLLVCVYGFRSAFAGDTIENQSLERFEFTGIRMAVPIKIVLYAAEKQRAEKAADAAFERFAQLDAVMSDYNPESELRRLCRLSGPGCPVRVSDDLWRVISCAQEIAEKSGGAFDITVGPYVRLWRRARRQRQLPSLERLNQAKQLVGYRLVRLHPETQSVELLREGMRLDLGGIAKGYAIDQALLVLKQHGIECALVDAGGDIGTLGRPPEKPGWLVAVAGVDKTGTPAAFLWLADRAVATSGDMWQFVEIEGTRYSHIVDPRTGWALTDHSCVTVVADNCTVADALASAISVLGPKEGLELADRTCGVAALFLQAPEGKLQMYASKRWADLPKLHPQEVLKQRDK